jgi:glycosyltransferase involved in cell wall biosynthesis
MQKVEQSMLAAAVLGARVIPNGVDLSVFRPTDRQAVRAELGIPKDVKVLLFAAKGIRQNIWKDYQTLRAVISQVAAHLGQSVLFIALGEGAPAERIGQAEVCFVPYQKDPEGMAGYYQAADIYVHAGRADTFPNMVLEALACGTPVVGTAIGGIPEQVKSLEYKAGRFGHQTYGPEEATGILVPPGDVEGMATSVEHLLSDEVSCHQLGGNAARDARFRFNLSLQADEYLAWYEAILQRAPQGGASIRSSG